MTDDTQREPIEDLIARSSLGAAAWCAKCTHPDLVHDGGRCYGESACECDDFQHMTIAEWKRWQR